MMLPSTKLPYDAEVEYLVATGDAYINTGIAPNSIRPVLEVTLYKPNVTTNIYPIGSDGSGNTRFSIGFLANGRIEFRIGIYQNNGPYDPGWYKIKLDGANGEAYLDDVLQFTYAIPSFSNLAICLFRRSFRTTPYSGNHAPSGMLVSNAKLWDNTTLLLDLVPVRIGNVGYMYNLVNDELFGSPTSNGFNVGPDVISGGVEP